MKISVLDARVLEALLGESPQDGYWAHNPVLRDANVERIRRAIRLTLQNLDLHIADDGEIYSPAPKSAPPRQQNARWRGGRRRR